ncbi:MAG: FxLYD domain-containing protein [Thermoanaerobaculia bacterium]|nr:FxLYD domain-containing protein [Thermoanaerobaculia bacterium]
MRSHLTLRSKLFPFSLWLTALLFSMTSASFADVLMLKDGSSVETKGPWEVRGSIVVFTLPNGSLSSLRTTEIDLDRSAQATVKKAEPPAAVVAEPIAPVVPAVVLTDSDVGHVKHNRLPAEQLGTGDSKDGSEGSSESSTAVDATPDARPTRRETETRDLVDPAAPSAADRPTYAPAQPAAAGNDVERLQVTSWQEARSLTEIPTTRIVGILKNSSQELTSQIKVTVLLYDASGNLLATSQAKVIAGALRPEQSTTFSAEIPGIATYDNVEFETEHVALAWRPTEANR